MTRTIKRGLFTSIMAFALVCAMMVCGATSAFAAELPETTAEMTTAVSEETVEMAAARGTVYNSDKWTFSSQKDTDAFNVSAGQSVSFNMGSLSSSSGQGFEVKLCRMVNGVAQLYGGPIHVEANRSYGSTITFNVNVSGSYIIRCDRTNDGNSQIINNVSVYVG